MKVLVFGGCGYLGSVFVTLLYLRGYDCVIGSRNNIDYYDLRNIKYLLVKHRPDFVINAAGYTGVPNVDACEDNKEECRHANAHLPISIASVCSDMAIPFGHISSGCIYNGFKADGYTEEDAPNFTFESGGSFYSGTKAYAEELLKNYPNCYLWRLRMPFSQFDHPKNYLTKLLTYPKLIDMPNSLSHLGECVSACLDLWEQKAPYGIYNVTNQDCITARTVIKMLRRAGVDTRGPVTFFKNEAEFLATVKAPRSNCYLNTDKLTSQGIKLRTIGCAMIETIEQWQPNSQLSESLATSSS